MSQIRKSTRKKRQTQLSFTPVPSSSPALSQYPEQVQQRAASVRCDSDAASPTKKRRVGNDIPNKLASSPIGKSMFGSKNARVVIESSNKKPGQLPTPAASSQLEVNQAHWSDSSEDDLEILPKVTSKPRVYGAEPKFGSTDSRQDGQTLHSESEEDIVPVRRARRKRIPPTTLSSDEASDPQNSQQLVTPIKRAGARPKVYTVGSGSSGSSEAEIPTRKLRQELSISPQSQRTGRHKNKGIGRSKGAVSNKDVSDVEEPVNISDGNDSSSSDDVVVTPARRRRSTAQTLPPPQKSGDLSANDTEDLEDEVNDLQGSDAELRSTRTRGRQINSARSIRQQKLEELKKRRAGLRNGSEEESEYSQKSDDASGSGPEPIHHAMRRGGDLDEYEEDFVDDDDETLGVEMDAEALRRTIPIEFTRHANKKTIEHFKDEVEWMVHNKLNPAFKRHDEIYEVAHRKLDDEFRAYAGSKFISAVWNPEFEAALKGRPEIYITAIPTMLEHKCDACRRSNHPPKNKVTFAGEPYDRNTLEPIVHKDDEDDSDESSSEGDDNPEDEQQDFFLGRFCCANAEMAHALYHWRYALNQTVLEWLARVGHLTPEKIVERDNMHQKKREKATNKIIDGMEATGVMKELYKQFKENLAAARDSKPTRFSR